MELFIVYDNVKDIWYFCKVQELINEIMPQEIRVSDKGVLYFGDYLSLQRKGGDSNVKSHPKDHPLHPSNQLQFKIKPLGIVAKLKSTNIIRATS